MRTLIVLVVVAFAGSALASREQTHSWKSATVAVSTSLVGDVEVKATADATGNVKTVDVVVKGKTITVPAKWIATLPAMPLGSLEIRTERGHDPEPWLYVFFRNGVRDAKGTVELHLAVHGGKLKDASVDTYDGKGGSKHETKPVP
jgi:hypothetical protein